MKHFNSWLTLLALTASLPVAAQTVDQSFAAATIYAPGSVSSTLEQPDGKLVVAGAFTRLNGSAVSRLLRFNADGTPDAAFQQNVGSTAAAYRVRQQANGQLLLSSPFFGTPLTVGGISRQEPVRLNADGTGDASFDVGTGATETGYINDMLPLPNGQTIVVGYFTKFNTTTTNSIVRLTTTGTVDATFNSGQGIKGENGFADIHTIVAAPGGKVLIGGEFSEYNGNGCNGLARLNADGSFDPSFTRFLEPGSVVNNIVVQADGQIVISGGLSISTTPNQSPISQGLARLLPTGAYDTSFGPNPVVPSYSIFSYSSEALQVQPDNKIVFISAAGVTRLNVNGTLDATFRAPTSLTGTASSLTLLANGKLLAGGNFTNINGIQDRPLVLLNANGTTDATFQPLLQSPGAISVVTRQADGKLVVGGNFSEINGQTIRRLARVNTDGTLDATFAPGNALDTSVFDLALQADGRVLAATTGAVRRYLTNGTPDNSFNAPSFGGSVTRLLLQPNGTILAGGSFSRAGGLSAPGFLRLLADGSRDNTFAPATSGQSHFTIFQAFGLQPDGKLVVAGRFIPAGSATSSSISTIARLESSGSLDASFTGSVISDDGFQPILSRLLVQPDGKILVAGRFSSYGTAARTNVARLNADGTLDMGFTPPTTSGTVNAIVLQPNNRVLIGGLFSRTSNISGLPSTLARLLPDGQVDTSFGATAVPNGTVNTLLIQPDGGIVVGGAFSSLGGQVRQALGRITAPNVLHVAAPRAVAERTQAWPVPAHTTLHVAPDASAHAQSLDLLDALGRRVRHQELTGVAPASLSLEALPAGSYLLRVAYTEGLVMRRIQVE
jgi:uncharacterized delta-60 repeat protein